MPRRTHEEIVKIGLSRPGVKKEYDALEDEFSLLREMLRARIRAKKTQEDVAKAMGTTTSVVGRLETSGGSKKHSPTLATLRRYADALECDLKLTLVKRKA